MKTGRGEIMRNKKSQTEFSFLQLALVGFLILLLVLMIGRYIYKPSEGTFTPIINDIEGQAGRIADMSEDLDMDLDGVPDEVDQCCSCSRMGADGVDPNTGCAAGQAKTVCTTPCGSGTTT